VEYQVKLPLFEGPLDLLLHLIEKQELDITAISLAQVTDQYLEHLNHAEELNPDSLASFVVVAAKLLVIKSAALLPSRPLSPREEEAADELTTALLEYQLFRRAADRLRSIEESGARMYSRVAPPPLTPVAPVSGAMEISELREALTRLWNRASDGQQAVRVPRLTYTVSEKIESIRLALAKQQRVAFSSLLSRQASRLEIIVTFLAVLELFKDGSIEVVQQGLFGDIYLETRAVERLLNSPPTAEVIHSSHIGEHWETSSH